MNHNECNLYNVTEYCKSVTNKQNKDDNFTKLKNLTTYLREISQSHTCDTDQKKIVVEKLLTACEIVKREILTHSIKNNGAKNEIHSEEIALPVCEECDFIWEAQNEKNVFFSDVVGGQDAIEAISESIIIPLKYKVLFLKSKAKPWRGLLLYGPPGTESIDMYIL
jgi:ATP-dependent 26S proteasome regulatory subunit